MRNQSKVLVQMPTDFIKCSKCGLALISEEILSHKCREIERGKIEDGLFWVFDGETWYPEKLHSTPDFEQRKYHPKDEQNLD